MNKKFKDVDLSPIDSLNDFNAYHILELLSECYMNIGLDDLYTKYSSEVKKALCTHLNLKSSDSVPCLYDDISSFLTFYGDGCLRSFISYLCNHENIDIKITFGGSKKFE